MLLVSLHVPYEGIRITVPVFSPELDRIGQVAVRFWAPRLNRGVRT